MKVNQKRWTAYRNRQKTTEIFSTAEGSYDVILAQFLIVEDDRDPDPVNVESLAIACGFDRRPVDEENGFLWFQQPGSNQRTVIDHEHAQKDLDLEKPLILLPNGKVLDGHHRLYRAFILGVEVLNAFSLTCEEADECLRPTHDRVGPYWTEGVA